MSDTVTGSIRLRVRGQLVEMMLTAPKGPTTVREMLPVLQTMSDHLVAASIAGSTQEGKTVSCREGCDFCCYQLIPLAEPEASRIAALVDELPEDRRTEVRERFAALISRLEDEELLEPMRGRAALDKRGLHALGMRYFALGLACPFLENRRCSIHAERPLVCREHLVTSPAANCERPTASEVEKVPMPASVFGAVVNLQRTEETAAGPFVPLPLALEWRGHKERREPGPKLLQRVMEGLSGKKLTE